MTIAVGTVTRATDPGAASSISKTYSMTTGCALIVVVECDTSRTVSGVSDGTNTYTQRLGPIADTSIGMRWYVFTAENVTGGSQTVTASFAGGSSAHSWMLIQEVTGQAASSYDNSQSNTQFPIGTTSTDAITTGTASNANQPALVWGFLAGPGSSTQGTGFTFGTFGSDSVNNVGGAVNWVTENKRVTATGSQAATWTAGNAADNCMSIMVILDESTGSGVAHLVGGNLTGGVLVGVS